MTISASSSNPVRPIKSGVTLTCTVNVVELSPQANTTVILNIVYGLGQQVDLQLSTLHNLLWEVLQPIPVQLWSAHLGEMNLESTHAQLV